MSAQGVVVAIDKRELIDGVAMLEALKQPTFRADSELLGRFEARMRARKS